MRKGVAFIEILIIIAIISGIVAFLAPVFATTQTQAGIEQCQARGKKLGAAMLAYMSDNDGRFPGEVTQAQMAPFANITWKWHPPWPMPSTFTDTWGGGNGMKDVLLAKYVKNKETWICPAPGSLFAQKYAYGYRCSWFFSMQIGMPSDAATYPNESFTIQDPITGRRSGQTISNTIARDVQKWNVQRTPSQKILGSCFALGDLLRIEMYSGGPVFPPSYPHDEGSLYLYCDGHVVWHETGRLWAPVGYTNHRYDVPHPRT